MSTIELVIQAADRRAAAASTAVERAIQEQAQAAFLAMWDALMHDPTMTPREAIAAAQAKFSGAFAAELAQAFSDLLQASIGTAQVLAMPVGEITLSARLYAHAQQVTNEVAALVREHARGITQARELSRRLYDGYDPKDGIQRPLEGTARGELPKALRTLTEDMPARRELTTLQVAGQQQAARLKSQALRAAYLESFKAWEDGAGQEALKKRLQVAQREKNRFLADRIAQTELSRAHQTEVAGLLMDDTETTVVQVRLNPAHPKTDICDLHGRADLWGLGPGNYPKAEAPVPPYHPFCLLGDTLITTAGRITAVSKRWFNGDVVVITTASGKSLSATVNHPVLTPRGWVGAGMLHIGDEVISRLGGVSVSADTFIDDQHQDVPSSIAEIADSFLSSREVTTREVPTSAEHFHGDGMAGDVAVIGADGKLWDWVDAGLSHVSHDAKFGGACAASAGLLGDSVLDLGGETTRDTTDGLMGSGSHGSAPLGTHSVEADETLLRLRTERDPSTLEASYDGRPTDADLARNIKDGSTGPVFVDQVVDVYRYPVSCHVYNLETTQGHYTGNGIVTHNCNCRLRSMPSLSAAGAKRVEGGEAAYLASLGPVAAARVMGSHARARQVLEGEAARKVADAGKPKAYRTTTVGTVNPRSRP